MLKKLKVGRPLVSSNNRMSTSVRITRSGRQTRAPSRLSDTFEEVRAKPAVPAPLNLDAATATVLKEGLLVKEASDSLMAASENVLKSGDTVLRASDNVKTATDIVLQAAADVVKAYDTVHKIAASVTDTRHSMRSEIMKFIVDEYTFERITDNQRGPGMANTYQEFIFWNANCLDTLSANELVAISTICKMIAKNTIKSVDTEYCSEMTVDSLYFNASGTLCLANPR